MATITDYASLVTAVTEYLARDQDTTLIARIPTFIQLAEAKFNRQLFVRQMEARATTPADTGSTNPSSFRCRSISSQCGASGFPA
jgi:hypothetical protein